MSAFQSLLREIQSVWPIDRYADLGVLIGVSGGADSVALARAIAKLRSDLDDASSTPASGFLVIAHLNHGLRGEASDNDEAFVRRLATELDVKVVIKRVTGLPADEASLRDARMDFLVATAKRLGTRYIALAHHQDDNVETVLHHLLRGTGPAGLAGVPARRVTANDFVIVRPMLRMDRGTIREALREIDQAWCEDQSNLDLTYTRNWIRHELIPLIQTRFPNANDAMARAIDGWRQSAEVIEDLAEQWLDQHEFFRAGQVESVMFRQSPQTPSAIIVRAMQLYWDRRGWSRGNMLRSHWNDLQKAIAGDSPNRFQLPGPIDVWVSTDAVYLRNQDGRSTQ